MACARRENELLLAFEFGLKHIGVAVGQTLTCTANALDCLRARDGRPDWDAVDDLIRQWHPNRLIVGLPLNMDGSDGPMTQRARAFARRLAGRSGLSVDMVDERLTSRAAREENYARGLEPQADHAVAARLLLRLGAL